MLVGIYDDGQTLYNADTAFPEFQQLRAQIIRIQLRPVITMDDFTEVMTEEGAAIHARNEQLLAGD